MSIETVVNLICYLITLAVPTFIIAISGVRRDKFALRAVASSIGIILIMLGIEFLLRHYMPQLSGSSLVWAATIKYFISYILIILGVFICFDCDFWASLYCGTAGYCVQHISSRLQTIICSFIFDVQTFWVKELITLATSAVLCLAVYAFLFIFNKNRYKKSKLEVKNKFNVVVATCIAAVPIFYSPFGIMYVRMIQNEYLPQVAALADNLLLFVYLTSMLIAFLAFAIEMSLHSNDRFKSEKSILTSILQEQQERFLQEKLNIDLINIKCHDIRHQLNEMKDTLNPEAIDKIADTIEIYDSKIETGNEAISTVLAKYSLYAVKNNIKLTCMLDGSRLNFIPAYELYAIFGNAVENAINAVGDLPQPKRIVSITQKTNKNLMNISISNFFAGDIDFDNGLPTNRNENHGYGIKSIKMIIENYGGRINVCTSDDVFVLNIFLPIPNTTK